MWACLNNTKLYDWLFAPFWLEQISDLVNKFIKFCARFCMRLPQKKKKNVNIDGYLICRIFYNLIIVGKLYLLTSYLN